MINDIIHYLYNGQKFIEENISGFLADGKNAVFFMPDNDSNCLKYIDANLEYIKKEKKLINVLYLLPEILSGYAIKNDKIAFLPMQKINDLWQLSLQSSVGDNYYLLSFNKIPGREFIPSMTYEKVIMNGVLCIPAI